ncbi:MAG: hypothetical protein AAF791_10625 [Bacteroidota bacterium]
MALSSRSRPAPPAEEPRADASRLGTEADVPETGALESDAPEDAPEAPAGRLGRWLPKLGGLVHFAYRTAWVSAGSALVLWWALAGEAVLSLGGAAWVVALGFLLLLLVPAGAAWLLGLTLRDVLSLPETIRRSASAAAQASREALRSDGNQKKKRGRVLGVVSALWAVRGFVLDSRGAWAKAATAARVVRLAKLPFTLGLLGLFLLNGAVILAGLLALVLMLA